MIHKATAYKLSLNKHSVYQDVRQIAEIIIKSDIESILDLGSGIGILAKELQDHGVVIHQINGSREMLEIAKVEHRVFESIVQGNITALPYRDEFVPAAVLSFVLHHLKCLERQKCLRECHRVLERQGKLFIVDRIPRSRAILKLFPTYWYFIYRHQHQWNEACPELRTLEMLRTELCSRGFTIQEARKLREPRSKALKSITIPKMVVIATKN